MISRALKICAFILGGVIVWSLLGIPVNGETLKAYFFGAAACALLASRH